MGDPKTGAERLRRISLLFNASTIEAPSRARSSRSLNRATRRMHIAADV
jgi:hypothetical protein